MTVIDVHTHMLNDEWLDRIVAYGGGFTVKELMGQRVIHEAGAPFMTLMDPMFDYEQRIRDMDECGVDVAIVSLTCPSCYWGGEEISTGTARMMNDDMAGRQKRWPDRIRFFATLPWQYPDAAVTELERALELGAVGVFVSASVAGTSLTDPLFAPVWKAIDDRALPVLVHPGAPPGVGEMDMQRFNLVFSVGFMFDTTLAVSRMIFDGFFDTHQKLKIIVCHAGGALPYLMGRLDTAWDNMPPAREKIDRHPSEYFEQLYFDSISYTDDGLDLCHKVAGRDRILYGSDYPHNVGDMKGCLARIESLPADAHDAIKSKNAERIFNL